MNSSVKSNYEALQELAITSGLDGSHGIHVTYIGQSVNSNSIMFVGIDTNGVDDNVQKEINDYQRSELTWLNGGYKYTKSPFLRTIGKISSALSGSDFGYDVYKSLIWTNLFKIAPCSRNKASQKVKNLQLPTVEALLLSEIQDIKPRGVVFLTGSYANPFLEKWKDQQLISGLKVLDNTGLQVFDLISNDSNIPAILVNHPQDKSHRNESDLQELVVSYFNDSRSMVHKAQQGAYLYSFFQALKDKMEKEHGNWWIYGKNDLGQHTILFEDQAIGIESIFNVKESKFSIFVTTWESKAKEYVENSLLKTVNSQFGVSHDAITRAGDRINIETHSIGIYDLNAINNHEMILIQNGLKSVHNFLINFEIKV